MGDHAFVLGKEPERFTFNRDEATVRAQDYEVQRLIDHFKEWLPKAAQKYIQDARQDRKDLETERERLQRERQAEEQRRKVLRGVRL